MSKSRFEYGPVPRGIYYALIAVTPLVFFISRELAGYYLLFLFFLGFGLKAFLVHTGIHSLYQHISASIFEKSSEKHTEKRRLEIERKVRDDKHRGGHRKDPRLPKNW